MKHARFEKMKKALEALGCDVSLFSNFEFYETGNHIFGISHDAASVIEGIKASPYAAGIEIGKFFKGFAISLPAATFACPHSSRKTVVNDLGEKLFTYGRDVFLENIVSGCQGLCLVVNERGECLGMGHLDQNLLENRLDIGGYLRGFGD